MSKLQTSARLEAWATQRKQVAALLRDMPSEPDRAAVDNIEAGCAALRGFRAEDNDTALYMLLFDASYDVSGYSASHAITCAIVSELAALQLGASEDEVRSLALAALTMNLAIASLQDTLAVQTEPLSDGQRAAIDGHGHQAAAWLQASGVADAQWLRIVENHHVVAASPVDLGCRTEVLTEVLRRVDIYTAKLSCRATRPPTTPMAAAREACLDVTGQPDAIGAAMLRAVGLYPPGTWVQLASEELALVIRTGRKAHTPFAVAIRRHDGTMLPQPTLRDTSERQYLVRNSVDAREVRVRVDHVRTLSAGAA